ncbi:MAG: glycosyltransferase, partial [Candidatus Limnocylindrales bacterium]
MTDPSDHDATADTAEAEARAAAADVGAAEQRRHAAAEISLRAERNRMLSEDLRQAKRDLQQARKETKEARRELAALRNRRVIKLALAAADRARPAARIGRRFRSMARHLLPGGSPATTDTLPRKPLRATPAEDAAFRSRLAGVLRSSRTTTGPLVSAIVVTRDGIEHVRRLLPALERLAYRDLEVVIVDNGSADATVAYAQSLTTRLPIRVVRNPENRSFSEANNQGAAAASGELLLLINNDVEP